MADIKEAFELYDESGEGFVSVKDCANIVRAFGHNPTEHELQSAIIQVDNGGGKLTLADVTTVIGKMSKPDYATQVREAFKVFDKDGHGSIDTAEIKHILINLGERMSEEEVNEVLKEAGLDGKPSVNCEDFVKIMLAAS